VKRTTCDGLLFHGAATDNCVIAAHADNNNKAAFHATIRFRFKQTFSSASAADQYLFNKAVDANNFLRLRFESTDGKLYFEQGDGAGGNQFQLTSTTTSWTAEVWYTITASMDDAPAQRLLVGASAQDTDTQAAVATPNGGDMVIGSSSDGGADGFKGDIAYVVIGTGATATVALTTTADTGEEALLNKGIPPATAKVQYLLTLDEGRGLVANNRGSGTNNGVIDTGCIWTYGTTMQNCMSLDGLNDYAVGSAANVDISGSCSFIYVARLMSTYSTLAAAREQYIFYIDANNYVQLHFYHSGNQFRFTVAANGTFNQREYTPTHSLGDCAISIGTSIPAGMKAHYWNGAVIASSSHSSSVPATPATAYVGAMNGPASYDVSRPIFLAVVQGALSAKQALDCSRTLNSWLDLGLTI